MENLKSLDPRINRLAIPDGIDLVMKKDNDDQLITYQVFHQMKPDKPFQHVGIVHASDPEMGFVFAKEVFSRRQTCSGIWIIDTTCIKTTEYTDGTRSVYELLNPEPAKRTDKQEDYEVFHLFKRGKQHIHAGTVGAGSFEQALSIAHHELGQNMIVYNVWIARAKDFYRSTQENRVIWESLPTKKYREPTDYKASEKLKSLKNRLIVKN